MFVLVYAALRFYPSPVYRLFTTYPLASLYLWWVVYWLGIVPSSVQGLRLAWRRSRRRAVVAVVGIWCLFGFAAGFGAEGVLERPELVYIAVLYPAIAWGVDLVVRTAQRGRAG